MSKPIYARRRARRTRLAADLILVGATLAVALAAWLWRPNQWWIWLTLAGVIAAAAGWRSAMTRDAARWASGARGEEAVIARLRRLERRGWVAIHDLDIGAGNIDHILIGPGGIYALETKAHANMGRIPDRIYHQADRAAQRLARITGQPVGAIIVLTRSSVHRKDRRHGSIEVMRLDQLVRRVRRRRGVLDRHEVQRLAGRILDATRTAAR